VLHHHIKSTSTLSTTPPSPFQPPVSLRCRTMHGG
jgi:hypothetical protein